MESFLNNLSHAWDVLSQATLAVIMSVVGSAAKMLHDKRHGRKATWVDWAYMLPSAFLLGVAAQSLGVYLNVPEIVSAGLGGSLGWLGPRIISAAADKYLRKLEAADDKEVP